MKGKWVDDGLTPDGIPVQKFVPDTQSSREQILIIMAAVYVGAVIDKMNNPDLKLDLDKIPDNSRVLKGLAELEALLKQSNLEVLDRLLESLPPEAELMEGKPLEALTAALEKEKSINKVFQPEGYNQALKDIKAIISKAREEV